MIPKTMKAVVFKGAGEWVIELRPVPAVAAPDDVLLEVEAAAICGTDVHILKTPPGHPATDDTILCHEYTGKVAAVGIAVRSLKPGDRVVVDPNIVCGACAACKNDQPNMCSRMTTLGIFIDGGFAKYSLAPERALHLIPPDLDPELAVFAEPLACVVNATGRLDITPGDDVLVLGAGPIGLYFVALLKRSGAGRVIVSEPNEYRRGFAEKAGADVVIDPTVEDLQTTIEELTCIGVDAVVDAVGSMLPVAVASARPGGKVLLFGMNENANPEVSQFWITRKELTVLGSYISRFSFPRTVKILRSGILPLREMITHLLPLERIGEGFEAMREGRAIKVIVKP